MRTPYAMRTMMDEISTAFEDAIFETADPDGYGVWRTLVLDKPTTEGLGRLLIGMKDARIEAVQRTSDQYRIHFVTDPRADDPAAFNLDWAVEVLRGETPPLKFSRD